MANHEIPADLASSAMQYTAFTPSRFAVEQDRRNKWNLLLSGNDAPGEAGASGFVGGEGAEGRVSGLIDERL